MTGVQTCALPISDTAVLIFAFIFYPLVGPGSGTPEVTGPRDPRSAIAVARINFLHGQWKDKIVRRSSIWSMDHSLGGFADDVMSDLAVKR